MAKRLNERLYRKYGQLSGMQSLGGRVSVANDNLLASYRFAYDKGDEVMEDLNATNGTSTYLSDQNGVQLEIQGASGDRITRQSNEQFRYISGESSAASFGVNFDVKDGVQHRVGQFDDKDGHFLEINGTNINHVLRSNVTGSVVEEGVNRDDWNQDRLKSSLVERYSPSGVNLDIDKIQMVSLVLNWYGAGESSLFFKIEGNWHLANMIYAGNEKDEPIFGEPRLPVRFEIENTAATGESSTLTFNGVSVRSEGDPKEIALPFSILQEESISVTDTAYSVVLAIRPKATYKGKLNRKNIIPREISVLALDNPAIVKVIRDVAFDGTETWSDIDPESSAEYSTDVGTGFSGGRVVPGSEYVPTGQAGKGFSTQSRIEDRFPVTLNVGGTKEKNIVIAAKSVINNSEIRSLMNISET